MLNNHCVAPYWIPPWSSARSKCIKEYSATGIFCFLIVLFELNFSCLREKLELFPLFLHNVHNNNYVRERKMKHCNEINTITRKRKKARAGPEITKDCGYFFSDSIERIIFYDVDGLVCETIEWRGCNRHKFPIRSS